MIKFEKVEEDICIAHLTIQDLVRSYRGSTFYGYCGDGCDNVGYWYINWAGVVSLSDATVFFGIHLLGEATATIIRWCDLSMREIV